jgi:hypothetical protein
MLLVVLGCACWLGLGWLWAFGAGYLNNLYVAGNIDDMLPAATATAIAVGQAIAEYWILFGVVLGAAATVMAVRASRVKANVFDRWPTTFVLFSVLLAYLLLAAVWVALLLPLTRATFRGGQQ